MIELIVVTLFLSIIGVYTWSYMRSMFTTQKTIEEKTTIQQTGIAIMNRLTDDISQVFIVESYQKITFFKGDAHELSFTSLSHDAPDSNDRESDEAKITYALEADSEKTDAQVLTRKEVPYFTDVNNKDEDYPPVTVAHGITSLEFSFSKDGVTFVNQWDTTSTDNAHKLPKLVKITMTLKDASDREEYFETLIDLPMTDDVNSTTSVTNSSAAMWEPTSSTNRQLFAYARDPHKWKLQGYE